MYFRVIYAVFRRKHQLKLHTPNRFDCSAHGKSKNAKCKTILRAKATFLIINIDTNIIVDRLGHGEIISSIDIFMPGVLHTKVSSFIDILADFYLNNKLFVTSPVCYLCAAPVGNFENITAISAGRFRACRTLIIMLCMCAVRTLVLFPLLRHNASTTPNE